MKKSLLKLLVLTLILALTACKEQQKDETDVKSEDQNDHAAMMGRFREDTIELQDNIQKVFDFKENEDGILQILLENQDRKLCYYESGDKGKSWQKIESVSEVLPEDYRAASGCITAEGNIFFSAGVMSEELIYDKYPVGKYVYYELKNTGGELEVNEINLDLPEPEESFLRNGYGVTELAASKSGQIYGQIGTTAGFDAAYDGYRFMCFNDNNYQIVWTKDLESEGFKLVGNDIYIEKYRRSIEEAQDEIQVLDGKTGAEKEKKTLPKEASLRLMDIDETEEKIFYCNGKGIYVTDEQETYTEQLADGNLNSLSDVQYVVSDFFQIESPVFFVFMDEPSTNVNLKMMRYEYDENLATVPEYELKVYSLKDNDLARRVIADFQSENPNVYVNYEIGMDMEGAATVSDAINLLNTEIIGGNGPDVIFLNGLPWESYAEKGILEDMGTELKFDTQEDQLFENIISFYQQEGLQYAVPAGFQIPVIIKEGETVDSLEKLKEASVVSGDTLPFFKSEISILGFLANNNWHSIEENNKISKEALKELLETAKYLYDKMIEKTDDLGFEITRSEEGYDPSNNITDTSLDIFGIGEMSVIDFGYLNTIKDYANIYNTKLSLGTISDKVFQPILTGVSAKGKEKELAKKFILFMIGEEEQNELFYNTISMGTYFPIHKATFEQMKEKPTGEDWENYGRIYKVLDMEYSWPDQESFDQLETMIQGLEQPTMEDEVVISTFMEYGLQYLYGEKTLDTAVNEISRTIELYYAE